MQAVTVVEAPKQAESKESTAGFLLPELPAYLNNQLKLLKSDKELGLTSFMRKFTQDEKQIFLRAYVSTGGHFSKACRSLRADPDTVYYHFAADPEWQRLFTLTKLSMGQELQAVSYKRALEPNGTIDRMCQLKRFFPNVYKDSSPTTQIGVSLNLRANV